MSGAKAMIGTELAAIANGSSESRARPAARREAPTSDPSADADDEPAEAP